MLSTRPGALHHSCSWNWGKGRMCRRHQKCLLNLPDSMTYMPGRSPSNQQSARLVQTCPLQLGLCSGSSLTYFCSLESPSTPGVQGHRAGGRRSVAINIWKPLPGLTWKGLTDRLLVIFPCESSSHLHPRILALPLTSCRISA